VEKDNNARLKYSFVLNRPWCCRYSQQFAPEPVTYLVDLIGNKCCDLFELQRDFPKNTGRQPLK